jgi:hypothetical protein
MHSVATTSSISPFFQEVQRPFLIIAVRGCILLKWTGNLPELKG